MIKICALTTHIYFLQQKLYPFYVFCFSFDLLSNLLRNIYLGLLNREEINVVIFFHLIYKFQKKKSNIKVF